MELEEAHDNLLMLKYFTELEKQENWQDYVNAIDIVLKELESLQITNDLLYKTNKDLMKKQMQNIENIGTIELLGNEKWSIE